VHDKVAAAEALLAPLGIGWADVGVIGDDWPDLPLLARAGLRLRAGQCACRGQGRGAPRHRRAGGHGAAREFCDLLLMAAGRYAALLAQTTAATLDAR
jgi:3-deoxy-D-manno-octulosonate 8-phosphate phosphatase (KDO 8-P phosphatase)